MRARDMSWESYGISEYRKRELKNFCMQYDEKKNSIQKKEAHWKLYEKDVRMIESAAKEANKDIWRYIMRSVTGGLSYEQIEYDPDTGRIPYGKTDFYAARMRFFGILHKKKLGTN